MTIFSNLQLKDATKIKLMLRKFHQIVKRYLFCLFQLFLCLYLKDKPAFTQAILVGVEDWGFKISVPKYDCRVVLKLTDMKNIKVLKFEKTQDDKKYMHV